MEILTPIEEIILSPIVTEPKNSSDVKQLRQISQSNSKESVARNFDCLNTDDETDEEDDDNSAKPTNRPPIPAWSVSEKRRAAVVEQTKIPTGTVDKFFQCQYEQVDLLELFPAIEKKLLKRRKSSAFWNTPPRFSMLPKY